MQPTTKFEFSIQELRTCSNKMLNNELQKNTLKKMFILEHTGNLLLFTVTFSESEWLVDEKGIGNAAKKL